MSGGGVGAEPLGRSPHPAIDPALPVDRLQHWVPAGGRLHLLGEQPPVARRNITQNSAR